MSATACTAQKCPSNRTCGILYRNADIMTSIRSFIQPSLAHRYPSRPPPRSATRFRPARIVSDHAWSVLGFWDKNTMACAGAMPFRRYFPATTRILRFQAKHCMVCMLQFYSESGPGPRRGPSDHCFAAKNMPMNEHVLHSNSN